MTSIEDKLRAAIRARADEIPASAPPLRLPARRRRSFFPAYGGGGKKETPAERIWRSWGAPAASAIMVAVVILASAAIFGGRAFRSSPAGSPAGRVTHAHLIRPISAAFLGVYPAGPGYGPIASFAEAAGQRPDIVGYYSGWYAPFPTSYARTIRRHGAVVMVQIDPAYVPVKAIAAGRYDGYLSAYAESVRAFGQAVIIGFGHEMNAPWYSWGYGHTSPAAFVAAWRHVVLLFRALGADNVTWLWTINADQAGTGPLASWWPGARYVTWVGIDGYYRRPSDTFTGVFAHTIEQVRALTLKPVLLSDTSIAPSASQYANIASLFQGMRRYGMLGLVWSDQGQGQGNRGPGWRLEGNAPAEAAFRLAAAGLRLSHP